MGQQAMTKDQLVDLIKGVVGTSIADVVKENFAKEMDAARKANGAGNAALFGDEAKQTPKPRERKTGEACARIMRAIAGAAFLKRPSEYAETLLNDWGDADLSEFVAVGRKNYDIRAKAMGVTSAQSGGTLVPEQFSQDIIEFLRPRSVVRALSGATMPMPVGTVRIPKITSGSSAFYQGENSNATASTLQTGSITLTFKKLVGLVPISNDLLRYSSPGADAIVRNDMVRAIAQAENQAFLRGDGTGGSPRGLRFWCQNANVLTSAGTTLTNILTDLANAVVTLKNANVPMTACGWIMAPRSEMALMKIQNSNGFYVFRDEMLSGKLWGFQYKTTTQVPTNLTDHGGATESEVYLADFDECVIGESMNLAIDASSEAAYFDGSNVIAAYSQDQTVVRAIEEHDFAVRRDQAVAVLNGVNWS